MDAHLGRERGVAFRQAFGVLPQGNWEGRNVLHRRSPGPLLEPELKAAAEELRAVRAQRPRPQRDEKIIVAWNGFMISAFARAAAALDEPRYLEAAERAADFLDGRLWSDGRLLRHYSDGVAPVPAYLDDYAFFGQGLLDLWEASFAGRHLERALLVAREMRRLFEHESGGFAYTGRDATPLPAPVLDIHDGALPSGNAAAALFLLHLGHTAGDQEMQRAGRRAIAALLEDLKREPTNHLALAAALDFALGPVWEIVIAARPDDPATPDFLRVVRDRYLPNAALALSIEDADGDLGRLMPHVEGLRPIEGRATAYVCRDYTCLLPVQDAAALAGRLDEG